MHSCKDVPAALDDVSEPRVVDDDGIESLDVQRALPGRGHRKEIGFLLAALEKRADDPDRLAAVVVGGIDARKCRRYGFGCGLDAGARRQKHSDPALLLHQAEKKAIVEKFERILPHDFYIRGARRIERIAL